jgi:hypothetical protein
MDLRGLIHPIRVTVTDSSGRPLSVSPRGVSRTGSGALWQNVGGPSAGGVLSFAAPGPVQLAIGAQGYISRQVDGIEGERTIALEAAPRVTLRLRPESSLPGEHALDLVVEPLRRGERDDPAWIEAAGLLTVSGSETVSIDADGQAGIEVRRPVEYALTIGARTADGYVRFPLDPVDLAGSREGHRVEVQVDWEALRQLLSGSEAR